MQDKGQADLVPKLPKSVGFGMGLEFRESTCLLNAKNAALVKPGMVFNVSVGALRCSHCEHVQESSSSAQQPLPDQYTIACLAKGLSEAGLLLFSETIEFYGVLRVLRRLGSRRRNADVRASLQQHAITCTLSRILWQHSSHHRPLLLPMGLAFSSSGALITSPILPHGSVQVWETCTGRTPTRTWPRRTRCS